MKGIKQYLVPTLVLFLICFVAAALLGVTNDVTAPVIKANAEAAEQAAMKNVPINSARQSQMTTAHIHPPMTAAAMLSATP